MHVDDLRAVLPQLGFDYRMPGPAAPLAGALPGVQAQDALPSAQLRIKEASPMAKAAAVSLDELDARFGPHLNYVPPGGWAENRGDRPTAWSRRTAASAASSAASSSRCATTT